VRKKLDARGSLPARMPGIPVGLLVKSLMAPTRPELIVTMRNECWERIIDDQMHVEISTVISETYDNLEEEESGHQRKLKASVLGNTLESSKQA
jgi:hypothetical protein